MHKIQDETKFKNDMEDNYPGLFEASIEDMKKTRKSPDKDDGNYHICVCHGVLITKMSFLSESAQAAIAKSPKKSKS